MKEEPRRDESTVDPPSSGTAAAGGPSELVESSEAIQRDIEAVGRIHSVSSILDVICKTTGMGFSAVARVSERTWTACAVKDEVGFGLLPGGQLELTSTLCFESRAAREAIVIDHASEDPIYANHHTPRIYNLQSYISVPIIMPDGEYFGNLCAIDSAPHSLSTPHVRMMFQAFAELIGLHLFNERRREVEKQLSEAQLSKEREIGELREQFVAVLGHDLRGPLTAISSHAEILMRRPDEPKAAISGRSISAAVKRMARLVDDVLDFTRGRMGAGIALTLAPEPSIERAVEEVIAEFRVSHPQRRIEAGIDEKIRAVRCDRARLQQVVANLIANAIAYGDPTLPVKIAARSAGDDLELTVWNGGNAIPVDTQLRMFDPYWRPAHSAIGGGIGLGLYICAQIVRAHHGSIEVRSTEEDGTRFIVRIPL